ncbi:hypothetical protein FS827_04500 [Agrobacterium vitis]|uniref:hypothetical protein n=1 Tax=Allorhizobium ampelinum TaxID=3025782 RepID=UPI001F299C3D|nr:hypothetical protein [Allorhizobium ampelinum]MCF1460577.1 hypothetical protein [Allorhizobium ampelinum]
MRKDLGSIKVRRIKFSPEDEIGQLNRWIFNAGETQFRRSFRDFFGEYPALGPASRAAAPGMQAGFSPGLPIINAS